MLAPYNPRYGYYRGPKDTPEARRDTMSAIPAPDVPFYSAPDMSGYGSTEAALRSIGEGFARGAGDGTMRAPLPGGGCIVWNRVMGVPIPAPGGDWRECLFDYIVYSALTLAVVVGIVMILFGAAGQTVTGRIKSVAREAIE